MAVHKGAMRPAGHRVFELGPPVADRASLEPEASAAAVEFYFLTAAAERAWAAITARRASSGGALFWIRGPAGAGKTHFLNYILALDDRAGASAGRRAILRLPADSGSSSEAIEQRLLEALAHEIGAEGREAALWRRMRGVQALQIALDHARRVGIRSISAGIDLGSTDTAAPQEFFVELAQCVGAPRDMPLNVFVAARGEPPAGALALEVAPANDEEQMIAAMVRARRVIDDGAAAALYGDVDCGGFSPRAIFPFHPHTLRALHALADPPITIAALGNLIVDVLTDCYKREDDACRSPLLPPQLLQVNAIARRVERRLGEGGRAALEIAYRAADSTRDRARARNTVGALMLELLSGGTVLSARELGARLPSERGTNDAGLAPLLEALSARSAGVVIFDGRNARFDARAACAAEVGAFNAALPLIQRFDATLSAVAERSELDGKMSRLDDAMRAALEEVHRVGAALESVEREAHGALAPKYRQRLDDFGALAAGGARALVELGADPERRAHTIDTVAAYEDLAIAAAAAARMRVMREYLRATGLRPDFVREAAYPDTAVAPLVVECQLLLAALEAGVLPDAQSRFEALEARFEKFKWTYVAAYRAEHDRWRRDSERLAVELEDAREHFASLVRLNRIAALGAPSGAELGVKIAQLEGEIGRCGGGPIGPEAARCARCGFVLGAQLPERGLGEVLDQIRRALRTKLAVLSQGAIARLIRLHDQGHRLEGFLKITQAANTGALVRVLDDRLAAYLGHLLQEIEEEAMLRDRPVKMKPPEIAQATVVRRFEHPQRAGLISASRRKRIPKPPTDSER